MPIYEFYCPDCHVIYNFLSRGVDTSSQPPCPRCEREKLERQVSLFSAIGNAEESNFDDDTPNVDPDCLEKALAQMAEKAEGLDENDPRSGAKMMRELAREMGGELSPSMEEAVRLMEAGEDPSVIDAQMENLGDEDPFIFTNKKKAVHPPRHDEQLYDLTP